ncbi:hypothetical protein [uncultured Rhodospira sp.]|uniref:hypothetical protein n=1 Tax=uncultured Rhodospira sp. TaxID=1936189 RepID=UPI00262C909C|nr:hypothetical protein [uncultured Rhodospira sp.]
MARPLSLKLWLGLVVVLFCGLTAATLAIPNSPYVRYQSLNDTIFGRATWIFERIHDDPAPIDVLFVGSSRVGRGVTASILEDKLAARGQPLGVANISMPATGFDIRLTTIREALKARPEIKLIVFGVTEQMPRDGHQAFVEIATAREVLTSPWLLNRNLPANLTRLPFRQASLGLASVVPEAFGRRAAFDPAAYLGSTPDLRTFNDPDWSRAGEDAELADPEHAAMLDRQSARRYRELTKAILPESLAWIEFGVPRTYIERLADLADRHGVRLVFLYLPFYKGFDAPLDADYLRGLGDLWLGTVYQGDPENFIDSGHASYRGAELLTDWLVDRILATLGTDS